MSIAEAKDDKTSRRKTILSRKSVFFYRYTLKMSETMHKKCLLNKYILYKNQKIERYFLKKVLTKKGLYGIMEVKMNNVT